MKYDLVPQGHNIKLPVTSEVFLQTKSYLETQIKSERQGGSQRTNFGIPPNWPRINGTEPQKVWGTWSETTILAETRKGVNLGMGVVAEEERK